MCPLAYPSSHWQRSPVIVTLPLSIRCASSTHMVRQEIQLGVPVIHSIHPLSCRWRTSGYSDDIGHCRFHLASGHSLWFAGIDWQPSKGSYRSSSYNTFYVNFKFYPTFSYSLLASTRINRLSSAIRIQRPGAITMPSWWSCCTFLFTMPSHWWL